MSFIPNASSISPVTQVTPLVFVLLVTLLKDGIEDWVRFPGVNRVLFICSRIGIVPIELPITLRIKSLRMVKESRF